MSVKMMLMNILNDVEKINISDQSQDNALSETTDLISNIQANKQDKINVLSQINCNTISCNDLKIGSVFIKSEIENKVSNSDFDSYKELIESNIETITNSISNIDPLIFLNYFRPIQNIVYDDYNTTITGLFTFNKTPIINMIGTLTEFSGVNKGYVDNLITQPIGSVLGVHTIDRISFENFITSIPGNGIATNFCTFSFTALKDYSRFNLIFNLVYKFSSAVAQGDDNLRSYALIYQNDVLIHQSDQAIQYWVNASGGGGRSSNIFPYHFTVRPGIISSGLITIKMYIRNYCDEILQITDNNSAFCQCTEIKGDQLISI